MFSWLGSFGESNTHGDGATTIFDFKVNQLTGEEISLADSNYRELQELYSQHSSSGGLEIIAFPCGSFGNQEHDTNEQIQQFADSKGATFPVMGKVECGNTESAHPLFTFLRQKTSGIFGRLIIWNFTKFLCNSEGVPVKRYGPQVSPSLIESDIKRLLSEPNVEKPL
eukprot:gene11565-24185_t